MSEHLMRVGVIIENTKRQPRWLVELINSLAAEEYVNELILLTLDPKRRRGSGGYYRLKDRLSLCSVAVSIFRVPRPSTFRKTRQIVSRPPPSHFL